jgi:ribosomal protein RSM22 (predicted rRNA methylase)
VQLPDSVRRAIDERADAVGFAALARAAAEMSEAYRQGRPVRLGGEERAAAYLVTRMPATYAAAARVLRELAGWGIASVLDAGAGTGAAALAASGIFPGASLTLIERDAALAAEARAWLPSAETIAADLRSLDPLPQTDLVIAAYSLGEAGKRIWKRLWQAARVALAIVEPGTPRGFALIREIRGDLLAAGGRMVAPCTAETPCPMADPDWCHFAARVERSSLHRRIKHAELGYEDEKFSYVVVAREAAGGDRAAPPPARIIRHPRHQPGLIVLETCTPEGLRAERVLKRNREPFRAARRASWGDRWGTLS